MVRRNGWIDILEWAEDVRYDDKYVYFCGYEGEVYDLEVDRLKSFLDDCAPGCNNNLIVTDMYRLPEKDAEIVLNMWEERNE